MGCPCCDIFAKVNAGRSSQSCRLIQQINNSHLLQSTMFNALCENGKAEAANYPFCTIEPNVGIVAVPDSRLQV